MKVHTVALPVLISVLSSAQGIEDKDTAAILDLTVGIGLIAISAYMLNQKDVA